MFKRALMLLLTLLLINAFSYDEWENNRSYYTGETVHYQGLDYETIRYVPENTPPSDSWFWKELVSQQSDCEIWTSGLSYEAGKKVSYQNEGYISKRYVYPNSPPPNQWFWETSTCEDNKYIPNQAINTILNN